MFESGETRRARAKAAKQQQLSMMVSEMDGIDEAKVLYDEPKPIGFERPKVTATVSVRPEPGASLEAHQHKMIQEAIAHAISNLDPSNVAVFDQSKGSEWAASGVTPHSFDDPYYQTKLAYEQKLKGDIENLLHFIQPAAHVQVSAELDPMKVSQIESVRPDGDPAAIRETTETESTSSTQTEDRGQPGLIAQGPNRTGAEQAVAKNEQTTQTDVSDVENFVPHSRETRQELGLTPQSVRASVAIPSEYLMNVWRERTKDAAPDAEPDPGILEKIKTDTTGDIKQAIAQILPKGVAENTLSYVEVTFFQSLTPPPAPEPSVAGEALLWAGNNSGSLIMAGLAIVSLMMLRSMIKSIPAADASLKFKTPVLPDVLPENSSSTTATAEGGIKRDANGRPRLRLKKGPTLKDDLAELVKEDPDAAAAILRNWIGNAA
jgi:flagellar M-ring protein FliF